MLVIDRHDFAAIHVGAPWWRTALQMLIVVTGCLLATSAVAARPFGVVSVDFRPAFGDVPTHLCVASYVASPRTRTTLQSVLESERLPSGEQRVDTQLWGATGAATCSTAAQACDAQVRVPVPVAGLSDQLHLACTEDTLGTASSSKTVRLAVLLLEQPDASPPPIDSVSLTGGVASIGVSADLSVTTTTVRNIGGHYLASDRSYRAERLGGDSSLAILPLEPRCRFMDVSTPQLALSEADRPYLRLSVQGDTLSADTCVASLTGTTRWRVAIAAAEPGQGQLDVELSTDAPRRPDAHYIARWPGRWPEQLELQATALRFSWRAPACIYPRDQCPHARLADGTQCAAQRDGEHCQYTCPDPSQATTQAVVTTPVTVTFEHAATQQSWREILPGAEQILSSYVPREETYLAADVHGWNADAVGSRITHLELLRTDGTVERHAIHGDGPMLLPVPRASCAPLRYQIIGDRRYREGEARVIDGELRFEDVHQQARVMEVSATVALGGSLMVHGGNAPANFPSPAYLAGHYSLAAVFKPKGPRWSRLALEARLAGFVGEWSYIDDTVTTDLASHNRHKLLWIRVMGGPAVRVQLAPRTAATVGVVAGGSWPASAAKVFFTGRFGPVVSPSADLRFAISPRLRFVLQGRLFLGEKTSYWTEPNGEPAVRQVAGYSLAGFYGLEFAP